MIEIRELHVHFPVMRGVLWRKETGEVRAVNGVSLDVQPGMCLGVVGESGSGKTTLGRALIGLAPVTSGEVRFAGTLLNELNGRQWLPVRAKIQMIFQDPYSSLNPRMTVYDILEEPLVIHTRLSRRERIERSAGMLERVGLSTRDLGKFPHEFSGGQRQRIAIARALILNPRLVIADEPVSALDVSIQAQILNLLLDLKKDFGLTMIFISHDLAVVRHVADSAAVMHKGKICELDNVDRLFTRPQHPYTKNLLASIPCYP